MYYTSYLIKNYTELSDDKIYCGIYVQSARR